MAVFLLLTACMVRRLTAGDSIAPSRPSYGRERRFLRHRPASAHARPAHGFNSLVLDFKIDVVHFFGPAPETLVKRFQEMHVVKALCDRSRIIPGTRDSARKDVNARGRQGVVGHGGYAVAPLPFELRTGPSNRAAHHVPDNQPIHLLL